MRRWLARHPHWTFDFTPTSSSWLNAVEGFFAKHSRRRLKHGVFGSVVDLQAAINRFVAEHNQSPKAFVWRADPGEIIAARARGFQALESFYYSLAKARIAIESWRQHYNTQRPHSSLGYMPPAPHALLWPAEPDPSTMAAKPTMH